MRILVRENGKVNAHLVNNDFMIDVPLSVIVNSPKEAVEYYNLENTMDILSKIVTARFNCRTQVWSYLIEKSLSDIQEIKFDKIDDKMLKYVLLKVEPSLLQLVKSVIDDYLYYDFRHKSCDIIISDISYVPPVDNNEPFI